MHRYHVRMVETPHLNVIWIFVLLVVVLHAICDANDFIEELHSARLRGECTIGKEGRLMLLPVHVKGKELLFMLDTGARRTGFDTSLRDVLGEPLGTQLLLTPAGHKRVATYSWPDATFNGRPFKADGHVVCLDLTELRQASNEKIYGIIGMDILRSCRLQIDFDRGIIRFLDTLPRMGNDLGTKIPIEMVDDCVPHIVGVFDKNRSEQFLIDTGAQGNSLRPPIFDGLVEGDLIQLGLSFNSITAGGELSGKRGILRSLSIGPVSKEGLRVARLNPSSLGLRYLSRFLVTFDFPDQSVYLRKGPSFSKTEPDATSGMSLLWIEGNPVVKTVKHGGPAERAGVRVNDVILGVNGIKIEEYDHFSLRQCLTSGAGKEVRMQIRSEGRVDSFELILDEDFSAPK